MDRVNGKGMGRPVEGYLGELALARALWGSHQEVDFLNALFEDLDQLNLEDERGIRADTRRGAARSVRKVRGNE